MGATHVKPSMFLTFANRVVSERLAKAAKEDTEAQSNSEKPQRFDDLLGSFINARYVLLRWKDCHILR